MFNQEMPKNYVPRAFMVRGVLSDRFGVFYEIVAKNQVYSTFLDYVAAVAYCDFINSI